MHVANHLRGTFPCSRFPLAGLAVQFPEHLLHIVDHLEGEVLFLDAPFVLTVEPCLTPMSYLMDHLRIELLVVNDTLCVDGSAGLYTHKPSATRQVGERRGVVGGADEGGIALLLLDDALIELARLHVGFLQDVFQESILALGHAVVLVQVDQGEACQCLFRLIAVGEIDTVGIVCAQLFGQDHPAERGFPVALRTDDEGYGGIAVQGLGHQPSCHHATEPQPEVVRPVGVVGRQPSGKRAYVVVAVPFRQCVQPVGNGVVFFHQCRFHISAHVFVPHLDAFAESLQGNGVQHRLGQRLPLVAVGGRRLQHLGIAAAFHVFLPADDAVTTETVAASQEVFHHLHLHRMVGNRLVFSLWHCLVRLIQIVESLPYQHLILPEGGYMEESFDGKLLVKPFLIAPLCQCHDENVFTFHGKLQSCLLESKLPGGL